MKRTFLFNHHPCVVWKLMLVLVLAADLSMKAAAHIESRVAVRTFNYAQLPAEHLANARRTTAAIFRIAGISLKWIDCRVPQSEFGAACTEPLAERGDLILRLMDIAPQNAAGRIIALGTSMLDREQRTGVLMTIDVFPIRAIAVNTSIDVSTLVGRAIAHEMGHLLLGSAVHTRAGLMRAFWSHDELSGLKPAHWHFTGNEAASMRHGLSVKGRTAN